MIRETVPLPIPSSFRPGNLLHWIPGRLGTKTHKKHQPPIANAPAGWDYQKHDRPPIYFMRYVGDTRDPEEIRRRAESGYYGEFDAEQYPEGYEEPSP